jgi:hypothetical protein
MIDHLTEQEHVKQDIITMLDRLPLRKLRLVYVFLLHLHS